MYSQGKERGIKMKVLVFDMDGTIADLYGVDNWLTKLRAEDASPYEEARPLYDMNELADILYMLAEKGWRICVTTWLSMNASVAYNKAVARAKKEWLARYNFPYDEIHCVKYGTTKANCTRKHGGYQILIDDNAKIRKGWHLGDTIDANENILDMLRALA